jgi:hypothetical protein
MHHFVFLEPMLANEFNVFSSCLQYVQGFWTIHPTFLCQC